jgi:hypothetical protein
MVSVVLRVRLMTGDRLDVTYDDASAAGAADAVQTVVRTLADDAGTIWARHGDRTVVLYGRGIAAIEVEPLGAVL